LLDRVRAAGLAVNHSIDILFFAECAHWRIALDRVSDALVALGLVGVVEVRLHQVENEDEASQLKFLGSPTIRIDGRDVEIGASERADFGLRCRFYEDDGKFDAAPPVEWIKNALVSADR
jgi:hypothetical protein